MAPATHSAEEATKQDEQQEQQQQVADAGDKGDKSGTQGATAGGLSSSDEEARARAARLIQSNYRGYRTRRELDGMGLDANSRWAEAFQRMRLDDARSQQFGNNKGGEDKNDATSRWKRGGLLVGQIAGSPGTAKRDDVKGHDPAAAGPIGTDGPVEGGPSLHERGEDGNDAQNGLPGGGQPTKEISEGKVGNVPGGNDGDKIDNVKRIAKPNQHGLRLIEWWSRGEAAQDLSKTMESAYWLEMVDRKHRYGSNLKPYHAAWSESDTKDNFFVWLDEGEGKDVDLPDCPRERLESERIEYLSADQRRNYIVDIKDGKLYWRRNGKAIDTTKGKFRDLGHGQGIVELGPDEQAEQERLRRERGENRRAGGGGGSTSSLSSFSSSSSSSSDSSDSEEEEREKSEAAHYGAELSKRRKRIGMLSSKGWMDHMLRKTVRPSTWIYVLNARRELYIGIKTTGKFQHSSFLYGGRVLSAGLLKVRNGTLTSLSPLSGHYRAGTAHFRHFIYLLQQEGVDLEHVTLSKSLLLLRGMEAYGSIVKAKKGGEKKKAKTEKKQQKQGNGSDGLAKSPESSPAEEKGEDKSQQQQQPAKEGLVPLSQVKQKINDKRAERAEEKKNTTKGSGDGTNAESEAARDKPKTLVERIRGHFQHDDK